MKGVKTFLKKRYLVLVLLWFLYTINYLDRLIITTFLPFMQEDLNLTPVQSGQLVSAFFFVYALCQIPYGFLVDKFGPKKIMGVSIVLFSIVTALTGSVKNFAHFIILRFGLAIGEAGFYPGAAQTIKRWFPSKEQGMAMSSFSTGKTVASALGPVILTSLSVYLFGGEWRPVFYVLAIPGLIGVMLMWLYVQNSPNEIKEKKPKLPKEVKIKTSKVISGEDSKEKVQKVSSRIFLKDSYLYLFSIIQFCQLAVYWGCTTWLTSFLVKQHGMDIKQMGIIATLPYIISIFSMILGGWLMDKVFHRMRPIALISYLSLIPLLLIIGYVDKGNISVLLPLLLLIGFFISFNIGASLASLQNRYPKEVLGKAIGISNTAGQFGSFLSPIIAGYLVIVNVSGTQNFTNVFTFLACIAGVGALCAFFLKEQPIEIAEVPTINNEQNNQQVL
ncbi:MFS transporter [Bacillus sp. OK048]|uniref:MFS transporter n=1 Tax=Bacillus sp. OK048 TaxID=1882761 RepID=UPI00088B6489|nr:MFS transporter [Bacillus sp. OK048]SDM40488.1 Sugar phosphate permease [Bacillus sp. OK048]